MSELIVVLLGFCSGVFVGWYWHGKTVKLAAKIVADLARAVSAGTPIASVEEPKPEATSRTETKSEDDPKLDFEGDR